MKQTFTRWRTAGVTILMRPPRAWRLGARLIEYLQGRGDGLSADQIEGLRRDGCDVEAVGASVRSGLDANEAVLVSHLDSLDMDSYAAARHAGLSPLDAVTLHLSGVDLGVVSAVLQFGGDRGSALEASAVGVREIEYRICRDVGILHADITRLHAEGVSLWQAARAHRRTRGHGDDAFDWFLVRQAVATTPCAD